jgi:hypothetical protein
LSFQVALPAWSVPDVANKHKPQMRGRILIRDCSISAFLRLTGKKHRWQSRNGGLEPPRRLPVTDAKQRPCFPSAVLCESLEQYLARSVTRKSPAERSIHQFRRQIVWGARAPRRRVFCSDRAPGTVSCNRLRNPIRPIVVKLVPAKKISAH